MPRELKDMWPPYSRVYKLKDGCNTIHATGASFPESVRKWFTGSILIDQDVDLWLGQQIMNPSLRFQRQNPKYSAVFRCTMMYVLSLYSIHCKKGIGAMFHPNSFVASQGWGRVGGNEHEAILPCTKSICLKLFKYAKRNVPQLAS